MKTIILALALMLGTITTQAETVTCKAYNRDGKAQVCNTKAKTMPSTSWSYKRMKREADKEWCHRFMPCPNPKVKD